MQRIFVIGDTHFGHRKVTEFRPWTSVEEHDAELVARWNSVVSPKDTVWHLGDVFFRNGWKSLEYLNGRKKLVLGNHDQHATELYLRYFIRVFGAAEVKGCLLTHVPVDKSQSIRYSRNIHGHMHSNKMEDNWYINVSAEQINYTPILLTELLDNRESIRLGI